MKYETVFWDFDGVILNSMPIRNSGFKEVLRQYSDQHVMKLMDFHLENGGLSRYVKFRHFQTEILKKPVDEKQISDWSSQFSALMRTTLTNTNLLIKDSVSFIKREFMNRDFYIVSGSDGEELRFLAGQLGIDLFFKGIYGSPTPKQQLVEEILDKESVDRSKCCLIGDSKNDFEAAKFNGIDFIGYNNPNLKSIGDYYVASFSHGLPR
ncbi:MAG: HAD hydrolase-like protein [Cyclobacteriaceae bacterium]